MRSLSTAQEPSDTDVLEEPMLCFIWLLHTNGVLQHPTTGTMRTWGPRTLEFKAFGPEILLRKVFG